MTLSGPWPPLFTNTDPLIVTRTNLVDQYAIGESQVQQ